MRTGDSDAHRGQVSNHDDMTLGGNEGAGRGSVVSIFTDDEDEIASEDDERPCERKRARAESDAMAGLMREPSRRRVDSTDAPT